MSFFPFLQAHYLMTIATVVITPDHYTQMPTFNWNAFKEIHAYVPGLVQFRFLIELFSKKIKNLYTYFCMYIIDS